MTLSRKDLKRLKSRKRKVPKPIALGFGKLKTLVQSRRAARDLLRQALAAATAVASVAAGAVALDARHDADVLRGRLAAVEQRKPVDLTPLATRGKVLATRVEALAKVAAALAHPARPPLLQPSPATSAAVSALAQDLAGTAASLAALGGRVEQSASQLGTADAQQAAALSALSQQVAAAAQGLATELSGQAAVNTEQTTELENLANGLKDTSTSLASLAAATDAQVADAKAAAAAALAAASTAQSFTAMTSVGSDRNRIEHETLLVTLPFTVPSQAAYRVTGTADLPYGGESRKCHLMTVLLDGEAVGSPHEFIHDWDADLQPISGIKTAMGSATLEVGSHVATLIATGNTGCRLDYPSLSVQRQVA